MLFLTIEASQPSGARYRVAFGCDMHSLVSWLASIGRLF